MYSSHNVHYVELYKRLQRQIIQECMNFEITKKIGLLTISFVGHCSFPLSFYSKKSQSNVCYSRNIISCSRQYLLILISVRDFIVGQSGVHVMAVDISIATYDVRVEINLAFSSTNC